jgi:hypothetical protein
MAILITPPVRVVVPHGPIQDPIDHRVVVVVVFLPLLGVGGSVYNSERKERDTL